MTLQYKPFYSKSDFSVTKYKLIWDGLGMIWESFSF